MESAENKIILSSKMFQITKACPVWGPQKWFKNFKWKIFLIEVEHTWAETPEKNFAIT